MIDKLIAKLKQTPLIKEECYVKGCHERDIETVILKRFDPIDHDEKQVKLCQEHRSWAKERNEVVEGFHDELREARADIGMENIETVQKWTFPQGKIREDVLDGSIKEDGPRYMTLNDAMEERR